MGQRSTGKNRWGNTALKVAKNEGYTAIEKILLKKWD